MQMGTPTLVIEDRENGIEVRLTGSARVEAANRLRERFLQIGTLKNITLAWKDAEHVDASVLQVLLAVQKELSAGGRTLHVEEDNLTVRHYLQVSGLAGHFPVPAASAAISNESPADV